MHKIPIAAAAALAMLTVAASAQTTTSPTGPRPTTPGMAPPAVQRPPAINPLTKDDLSNIEGSAVYGGDDAKVGYVSRILMDPQTKKIDRLVVTAGGMLGVGGHRVALPIDQFKWDADKGAFRLSTTLASVKAMPLWVEGAETETGSSSPPPAAKPLTGAGDGGTTSK